MQIISTANFIETVSRTGPTVPNLISPSSKLFTVITEEVSVENFAYNEEEDQKAL